MGEKNAWGQGIEDPAKVGRDIADKALAAAREAIVPDPAAALAEALEAADSKYGYILSNAGGPGPRTLAAAILAALPPGWCGHDPMLRLYVDQQAAALEAGDADLARLRAVASAAREVCDPMVADGGGDRWWAAHDALRAALAALDAAGDGEAE